MGHILRAAAHFFKKKGNVMEISTTARRLRLTQTITKALLYGGLTICIIHIVYLLMGHNMPYAEILCNCGIYPFIVIFAIVVSLHLCALSKIMLCYNFAVSNCILLQRNDFFGEYITAARIIMLAIGIVLFIITTYKYIYGYYKSHRASDSADIQTCGR